MKAITLWQPYASLVEVLAKRIETRSWSTKYRGPLAIHSALRRPKLGEYGLNSPIFRALEDAGVDPYAVSVWGGGAVEVSAVDYPRTWGHPMPLGCVLVTCELVDVMPMTDHVDRGDPDCLVVEQDQLTLAYRGERTTPAPNPDVVVVRLDDPDIPDGLHLLRDATDQLPFGDFRPGRFAWVLDRVQPLPEPEPARGRQGLWEWEPS